MNRLKLIIILFLLPLCLYGKSNKKYSITKVDIVGQISQDGSMHVIEKRTYKYKGRFKYAFQKLKKTPGLDFDNILVLEGRTPYSYSDTKEIETYKITETDDYVEVRWFFKAKNESRTFTLEYTISDLVKKYADTAVLYYQFIGREWKKEQNNVSIKLLPPENISQFDVKAWLHGPLWAEYNIISKGSIEAWSDNLPKKTFFEIRAIYPIDLFPQVTLTNKLVKAKILEEETIGVENANKARELAVIKEKNRIERWKKGKWVVIFFSILGLIIGIFIFNKFGRRVQVPYKIGISSEVPEPIKPALLQYILANREIYSNAIIGTIFDLARKKIIFIKNKTTEKKTFFGNTKSIEEYTWELNRSNWNDEKENLLSYENKLLEFIFDKLSKGEDAITLNQISKNKSKFVSFFDKWKKEVKKIAADLGWYDKTSIQGMYYSLYFTGLFAILNIPFIIFFGPWAIISGIATIIIFILSMSIPHRTLEGEIIYKKWNSLKTFLNKGHFKTLAKEEASNNMSDYLLYGTFLGVNNKMINKMSNMIPEEEFNHSFYWYGYHGNSSTSFASSFNSMVATTTSTASTASGTGGGASSGGGGGAGGGGGGSG